MDQGNIVLEPDTTASDKHLWQGDLSHLDHSVIKVPEFEEGVTWYRRLLGLEIAERRDGRVYLSSPVSGKIVIGLQEGGLGLAYVSYRARNAEALERIAARVADAGVAITTGTEGTRSGVEAALRFTLPTGHTMEVLHSVDPPKDRKATAPGYRLGGADVRTSHLQLRTENVREMSDFMKIVGFKVSTYVPLPDGSHMMQFIRCNEFHHQMAILTGKPGLHHVALELDTASFWQFLGHLSNERIRAEYGPGQHLEGDILFIYVRDPFGNRLEITGPMAVCGFDYPPTVADDEPYYHMNRFGPQPPESWYHEWT